MLSDKELKKKYKKEFTKNPEKYYPTDFLKEIDFFRNKCGKCGMNFWSSDPNRKICGDSPCSGGYGFINNSPAKNSLTYPGVWKSFSKFFDKKGYTPIKRYPVVARWRDDIPFVEASIDDFIPYVINGIVKPPANPLTVPQFCLRFNDIANVGITGSHYTGFVMIGQHRFESPQNYNPDLYLDHLYSWFNKDLKIPKKELVFHEDIWAGSGNFGPCVEIFSRGLELANQVYMQYKQTEKGYKDLNLKVLDMGMGHERISWFTNGKSISYETTFPYVLKKLRKETGVVIDDSIITPFLPYSGNLNVDEVDDINKVWKDIAKKLELDVHTLKGAVLPLRALYSVADHMRSLLFAISDGALPSNTGGGYNLRVIFRRSMDFVEKYSWNVDLADVCEWHLKDLKEIFPEVKENINEVREIIGIETKKYRNTMKKMKSVMNSINKKLSTDDVLELYDSQGISPEMLIKEGIQVKIPERFFEMVSDRHKEVRKEPEKKKFEIEGLPKTEKLYYDDYSLVDFKARVLKTVGEYVILDKTAFYPTSGGQIHDKGFIANREVKAVYDADGVLLHQIKGDPPIEGQEVHCRIDKERRTQLAQHHTAVHIVNGSAKKILGNHIWQAGADKTPEKARLDITHYESLSKDQINKIEKFANQMVNKRIPVESFFMEKDLAEKKYGFRLYQGGSIPGNELRIIKIGDLDVEACGGTHLKNTRETGKIRITSSKRIQDGIIRLEIKAGKAVDFHNKGSVSLANDVAELLGCSYAQIPEKCEMLFYSWKQNKKGRDFEFKRGIANKGDIANIDPILDKAAEILRVQKQFLPNTIRRFLNDLGIN